MSVDDQSIDTARLSGSNLVGAGIDTDDVCPGLHEGNGEGAVAAPEIENALARPRFEQAYDLTGKIGDKPRIFRVGLRIPLLSGDRSGAAIRWNRRRPR